MFTLTNDLSMHAEIRAVYHCCLLQVLVYCFLLYVLGAFTVCNFLQGDISLLYYILFVYCACKLIWLHHGKKEFFNMKQVCLNTQVTFLTSSPFSTHILLLWVPRTHIHGKYYLVTLYRLSFPRVWALVLVGMQMYY